jgi:hydrogenase expression/formation protein HypE
MLPRMNPARTHKAIEAVLFDFDGTLTHPGSIEFDVIRDAIRCPRRIPILEHIAALPTSVEREAATSILHEFEAQAARRSFPNEGAEEIILFLRARGFRVGIISRNSLVSIETALRNFPRLKSSDFHIILSRDDPWDPKPSPEGILEAARRLGIPVSRVLVVGDYVFDIEAGYQAGALTAFLTNGTVSCALPHPPDFILTRLAELREARILCSAACREDDYGEDHDHT